MHHHALLRLDPTDHGAGPAGSLMRRLTAYRAKYATKSVDEFRIVASRVSSAAVGAALSPHIAAPCAGGRRPRDGHPGCAASDRRSGVVPQGPRHTTASLAISWGANVKVVQRCLGDATAVITRDCYGRLLSRDLAGTTAAWGNAADNTGVSTRHSEAEHDEAGAISPAN